MIFVTGDTHRYFDFAKLKFFADANPQLTKKDYVIIAGDFGGVWSKETLEEDLDIYSKLPFTILFVDGNHENFTLLNSYPVSKWNGGKVHIIREDIIHLMRGQVFKIEDKLFFAFGGATSTDKDIRIERNLGWWEEETPTFEDMDEGCANLDLVKWNVDFIITHSCDEKALYYSPLRQGGSKFKTYPESNILAYFEEKLTYKHWYFGHFHMDADLNSKKTIIYQEIKRIV